MKLPANDPHNSLVYKKWNSMNCCVRCRCKPENRAANVWNNEQLQLKAKQLLDSWQGPLYVQMNRAEASDFPSPIKRQIVKKGTHVHQNFYRQWSPIVSTVFLLHLECFKHVCDLQKVFSMQNCAVSRLQGPGLSGCLPCCPCFFASKCWPQPGLFGAQSWPL